MAGAILTPLMVNGIKTWIMDIMLEPIDQAEYKDQEEEDHKGRRKRQRRTEDEESEEGT